MAINRLKYFRVMNAETQAQTAKAVSVTQPTYQRWETGKAEIPKNQLAKLASHFKTKELELLGQHAPKLAAFYDDEAPLDLQYYGECAIHFAGGSEPLLLSISEAAHAQAYRELQGQKQFIVIRDLGNRTVAIRRKAISEFYFSSEAYDTYGPDHNDYTLGTPIQMPDTRDWAIVEAIDYEQETGDGYISMFATDDIKRVQDQIMITDDQFNELIANGTIKSDELEGEKAKISSETKDIISQTHTITVQFSNRKRREIKYFDCNIFECIEPLIDTDHAYSGDDELNMIRLPYEGYHRTAFFNPDVLDYISFPTHKIEEGEIKSYDERLDDSETANDEAIALKRPKIQTRKKTK